MSLKGKLAKMGIIARPGSATGSAASDLSVTDDLTVTDDVSIGGDLSLNGSIMGITDPALAASTVMAATLTTFEAIAVRTGKIVKTSVYIDLTDAKSTTTDNDIIGDTGACHIGQVTEAINGIIFAGQVSCVEVPTTGADDIDLSCASVATGAYDADVTGLTNYAALMTSGGAHAIGTVKPFTALPTDDYYLYLSGGEDGTAGTYDAGILLIEMWGIILA